MTRYKDFPPGWNHIMVPTASRSSAKAGLAMYTPCRRRGELIQTLAWAAVSVLGPAALPGSSSGWDPPEPPERWARLESRLAAVAGSYDGHVIYERRERRPGVLLVLLREGVTQAFVKIRLEPDDEIAAEARALELIASRPHPTFSAPQLMGTGDLDGWSYLITSPLPAGRHRMLPSGPEPDLYLDVQSSLEGLPRPDGTPDHWRPIHGDLTPWNLRSFGNGPWLIDWESATWGPPHADETLYRATAAALGRPVHAPFEVDATEAISHWEHEVRERAAERERDGLPQEAIDDAILTSLAAMRARTTGSG